MPASPHDLTLERYRQDPQAQLLLADGTALRAALQTIATYDFTLTDGRTLAKTACIGVFPVPPQVILPMLITRAGTFWTRNGKNR